MVRIPLAHMTFWKLQSIPVILSELYHSCKFVFFKCFSSSLKFILFLTSPFYPIPYNQSWNGVLKGEVIGIFPLCEPLHIASAFQGENRQHLEGPGVGRPGGGRAARPSVVPGVSRHLPHFCEPTAAPQGGMHGLSEQ